MTIKTKILSAAFMLCTLQASAQSLPAPCAEEIRGVENTVKAKFTQVSNAFDKIPGWTGYAAGVVIGLPLGFALWRRQYKKTLPPSNPSAK